MMDHRRARPRGADNEFRFAFFVQFNESFGHAPRLSTITGIKGRLAATGLPFIKFDLATRAAQHIHRRSADAAPHLIDDAGYKQTHLDCQLPIADCRLKFWINHKPSPGGTDSGAAVSRTILTRTGEYIDQSAIGNRQSAMFRG